MLKADDTSMDSMEIDEVTSETTSSADHELTTSCETTSIDPAEMADETSTDSMLKADATSTDASSTVEMTCSTDPSVEQTTSIDSTVE